MKKKSIGLLSLITVMLLVILSGCSNSVVSEQTAAIDTAIAEMAEKTDEFYYFEYENLEQQVQDALKDQENDSDTYAYSIQVLVAEAGKIDDNKIELPVLDCSLDTSLETYTQDFIEAVADTIENLILNSDDLTFEEMTLNVELAKVEDGWQAELSGEDIRSICDKYQKDIGEKAEELLYATDGYKILQCASEVREYIGQTFSDLGLQNTVMVDNIEKNGDGFIVTISYPDPASLYEKPTQEGYIQYESEGKQFDTLGIVTAKNTILGYLGASAEETERKSESITVAASGDISSALDILYERFDTTLTQKAEELAEQINSNLVITAVEAPGTGVLYGDNSGRQITIETSADLRDIHVTFYKLSGTDLSEDGAKSLSAYIHAGDTLNIYLPNGNYKLIQGTGSEWFGDEYLFGPEGSYSVSDILITIESGYSYTLTLYGVSDGNMPTTDIPYPY